jgi:hypothetical protein
LFALLIHVIIFILTLDLVEYSHLLFHE